MRILKAPQFEVVTCVRCGTVFQPEPNDFFDYVFPPGIGGTPQVFTPCPICGSRREVNVIKE